MLTIYWYILFNFFYKKIENKPFYFLFIIFREQCEIPTNPHFPSNNENLFNLFNFFLKREQAIKLIPSNLHFLSNCCVPLTSISYLQLMFPHFIVEYLFIYLFIKKMSFNNFKFNFSEFQHLKEYICQIHFVNFMHL